MRSGMGFLAMVAIVTLAASLITPAVQSQSTPEPEVAEPSLDLEGERLISFDGAELGFTVWSGDDEPCAVLVAVHGMSEWADAFHLAAPWWASYGVATYAYDQRGFGRSSPRGVWSGSEVMVRDLRTAVDLVRERHPDATVGVIGSSMGGAVTALATEQAEAEGQALADRVILSAPAVRGWSVLPFLQRVAMSYGSHLSDPEDGAEPPSLREAVRATDNLEALWRNGRDPLFLHDAPLDAIGGLVSIMQAAGRVRIGSEQPTLVLYGANDLLIPPQPVSVLASQLGPCARTLYYPAGWHMLLRDFQAETVWRDVLVFLRDPRERAPSRSGDIPNAAHANALPLPDSCIAQ